MHNVTRGNSQSPLLAFCQSHQQLARYFFTVSTRLTYGHSDSMFQRCAVPPGLGAPPGRLLTLEKVKVQVGTWMHKNKQTGLDSRFKHRRWGEVMTWSSLLRAGAQFLKTTASRVVMTTLFLIDNKNGPLYSSHNNLKRLLGARTPSCFYYTTQQQCRT